MVAPGGGEKAYVLLVIYPNRLALLVDQPSALLVDIFGALGRGVKARRPPLSCPRES